MKIQRRNEVILQPVAVVMCSRDTALFKALLRIAREKHNEDDFKQP